MKNCLQWRHLREILKEATFMFLNELTSISIEWHMIFELADFLLKISANSEIDVEDEYVKNSCEKFDVANFGRFDFLLIEYEGDFDSVMRLEVEFHFRA